MTTTDKVPIPYFEAVGPDGKKIFKPKIWLERFNQYIERVYDVDLSTDNKRHGTEPVEKNSKKMKAKSVKIFMGTWTDRITRHDNNGIRRKTGRNGIGLD